jgi:DNA-binding LacI/PurR family transcriptional regulator
MHDAGLEPAEPLCVPPSPWNDATDGGGKCFAQVARYNAGHLAQPLTADDRPDAIMCLSDEAVSYVTAGIKLLHLDPARDVVVAGYDNYWQQTWGHQHEPAAPIATVDKHNDRVGEALVELLLEPPAGDSPVRRVIPPSLISDPARPTPDR